MPYDCDNCCCDLARLCSCRAIVYAIDELLLMLLPSYRLCFYWAIRLHCLWNNYNRWHVYFIVELIASLLFYCFHIRSYSIAMLLTKSVDLFNYSTMCRWISWKLLDVNMRLCVVFSFIVNDRVVRVLFRVYVRLVITRYPTGWLVATRTIVSGEFL